MLLFGAEAHDIFHTGPVVPASIEDDDFAGGRKPLDIALYIQLRLLSVRGGGQGDDTKDARTHPFGDGLDGAALSCGITSLEQDYGAQSFLLDPLLQFA